MSLLERINLSGDTVEIEPAEDDISEVAHVLSNDRRRATIEVLASGVDYRELPVGLSKLCDLVTEYEVGSEFASQERKRVYIGLYQTHLPAMEEAGVIEWDDRNRVDHGPMFDAYREAMQSLREAAR